MDDTLNRVRALWEYPGVRAIAIIVGSIAAAGIVERVLRTTLVRLARRTKTDLDDIFVAAVRRPVFLSVILIGLSFAVDELPLEGQASMIEALLETLGVIIWSGAGFRVSIAVLEALSRRSTDTSIIQPRTLPVFEMLLKVAVVGAAVYFMFLAWRIDLTAWLASAGIVGIAIGFAAKDTLANLFSGIFIVADAPYKVGDFILLDEGLRGQVTKIGIRSTRILTRDDVEITVPNAVIGASKIVNETGGPHIKQRIAVTVDVAYGSDIDLVREVLLTCPTGVAGIAEHPVPQVRFREFGGSGLAFELLVWLTDPIVREPVIDGLNCAIYKAFARAKIEIPFSQHDLHLRGLPDALLRALTPAAPPREPPRENPPS
jgi:small-conductance mechanosensitive channel